MAGKSRRNPAGLQNDLREVQSKVSKAYDYELKKRILRGYMAPDVFNVDKHMIEYFGIDMVREVLHEEVETLLGDPEDYGEDADQYVEKEAA